MNHKVSEGTVLVIADDAVLGGLIALNLQLRGFRVEQTDYTLDRNPLWAPAFETPDLIVVDLESADRLTPLSLLRILDRIWAHDVRFILAAERPEPFLRALGRPPALLLKHPSDVGAVVNAVRELLHSVFLAVP